MRQKGKVKEEACETQEETRIFKDECSERRRQQLRNTREEKVSQLFGGLRE